MVPAIFFNADGLRGPVGVPACTNSVGSCAQRALRQVRPCIAALRARIGGTGKYNRLALSRLTLRRVPIGAVTGPKRASVTEAAAGALLPQPEALGDEGG